MPFVPKIHKQILSALENSITPYLHRQEVAIGRVASPFNFSASIKAQLVSKSVPYASTDSPGYPIQNYWPKPNLVSSFQPFLGFLDEGAADENTIVHGAQAAKDKISNGIYNIRWQSPSVLFFSDRSDA
jgi:hypothetical protein